MNDDTNKDPRSNVQVREWTSKLRKEGYNLDRQIRGQNAVTMSCFGFI